MRRECLTACLAHPPQHTPASTGSQALKKLIKLIVGPAEEVEGAARAAGQGEGEVRHVPASPPSPEKKTAPGSPGEPRRGDGAAEDGRSRAWARAGDGEAIVKNELEKQFLKLLHAELGKTNHFFRATQQAVAQRCELVRERNRRIAQNQAIYVKAGTIEMEYSKLMRACVNVYQDIIALERYAVLNYTGFDKILKKHDKCTRYNTRAKYMKHFVQRQDFVRYPALLQLASTMEGLFEDLRARSTRQVAQRTEQSGDGADGQQSDTDIAINDMQVASRQMENLTAVQKGAVQAGAFAASEDDYAAASVLLSGLAKGLGAATASMTSGGAGEQEPSMLGMRLASEAGLGNGAIRPKVARTV